MKKALKIIIPIIMIVVGVAMCITAYAMGAKSPSVWLHGRDYSGSYGVTESFERIECDVDIMNINFVCGDVADGYTAIVDVNNVDEEIFECKVENGVLKINHIKHKYFIKNIRLGIHFNTSSEIDIIVPSDSELANTTVQLGIGEITFAGFDVSDAIIVENGVGEVNVSNTAATIGDFELGVGELKISECTFTDIDIDGGIGDIKFIGEILGNADIDHGIGDVKMELAGDYTNHKFEVDSGLGDEKLTGVNYNSSGRYRFDISSGIGDIKLYGEGLGSFDVKIDAVDIDNEKVTVDLGAIKVEHNGDDVKVDVGDIKVDTGIEKIEIG